MKNYDPDRYWEDVNSQRKSVEYLIDFYSKIKMLDVNADRQQLARAEQMRWMRSQVQANGWRSLLDAGCGPGFWFQLWNELSLSFTGVDRAKAAMVCAQSMADRLGKEVPLVQAPLTDLPFSDKSFDVAVTIKVLLHTPPTDILMSIKELGRVSRYLMLLEFSADRRIETRPHVFQHDYPRLFEELGLELMESQQKEPQARYFKVRC